MHRQKFEVRKSTIHGRGVFATSPIAAQEIVHRMSGEIISVPQCVYRVLSGRMRIDDPLQISNTDYIALDAASVSFNHSCEPNALMRGMNELISRRCINAGEEITFDYSATVKPAIYTFMWGMRCHCGSPMCRKMISDVRSIKVEILIDYMSTAGLQNYIFDYLRRAGKI
jgi:uncharacterized protein